MRNCLFEQIWGGLNCLPLFKILILPLLFLAASTESFSSSNPPSFEWTASRISDSEAQISLKSPPSHYVYEESCDVKLLSSDGAQAELLSSPQAESAHGEEGGEMKIYAEGGHVWVFKTDPKTAYRAEISYQGCAKNPFVCYPPKSLSIELKQGDSANSANPGSVRNLDKMSRSEEIKYGGSEAGGINDLPQREISAVSQGFGANLLKKGGILLVIGAFIGGLLSAMTPCVLPMIPITIAIMGAGKNVSKIQSLRRSLLYVLGIVITFTSLAVIASLSGRAFGTQILGNPYLIIVFAALFILLGFSMLGFYDLQIPSSIQAKLGGLGGGTEFGAFVMGLAAGFVAVPCTGPVLGVLIGIVAASGDTFFGILSLASYACGFGMPFIFVASGAAGVPKSGPFMDIIKSVLGIAILAIANFAIFIALPDMKKALVAELPDGAYFPVLLACAGFLMGAAHADGHSPKPAVKILKGLGALILSFSLVYPFLGDEQGSAGRSEQIKWLSSPEEAIELAKLEEKPVLIDFTAEWCAACKELEAFTFKNPDFVKKSKNAWIFLKIDATRNSAELDRILEKYQVKGFPTVILADSDGATKGRSVGFISPENLLAMMNKLSEK